MRLGRWGRRRRRSHVVSSSPSRPTRSTACPPGRSMSASCTARRIGRRRSASPCFCPTPRTSRRARSSRRRRGPSRRSTGPVRSRSSSWHRGAARSRSASRITPSRAGSSRRAGAACRSRAPIAPARPTRTRRRRWSRSSMDASRWSSTAGRRPAASRRPSSTAPRTRSKSSARGRSPRARSARRWPPREDRHRRRPRRTGPAARGQRAPARERSQRRPVRRPPASGRRLPAHRRAARGGRRARRRRSRDLHVRLWHRPERRGEQDPGRARGRRDRRMVRARRGRARRREPARARRAGDRVRAREEHRGRVSGRGGPRRPACATAGADQGARACGPNDGRGRIEKVKRSADMSALERTDPEVYEAIENERRRQVEKIELIASENYTSAAVMEAVGSVLTNKYAEGYPGRRYYGGCEWVDVAEQLAIDRAKALFGAAHANVQPHAGAQANMAAYAAVLKPGDAVLGLALDQGGHLTHGSPVNFSGKLYHFVAYGVRKDDEMLDYDELERLAKENRPRLIVTGATAYPRVFDFLRLRKIADDVEALLLVDMAHFAGLVAAGEHPTPVGYAQIVTTTTHKTLRGPRGGMILCDADHAKATDSAVFPNVQGGPLMHVIAGKAVMLKEAATPEFKAYAKQIRTNARTLAASLAKAGLRLVSGGTDNHLMLVDVRPLGLTGKVAEKALDVVGITVNKNTIPYDPNKPAIASGIRIGTPAVTTRGMKEAEMERIGALIGRILQAKGDETVAKDVASEVFDLTRRFPVPGITPEKVAS